MRGLWKSPLCSWSEYQRFQQEQSLLPPREASGAKGWDGAAGVQFPERSGSFRGEDSSYLERDRHASLSRMLVAEDKR